ncbi:MAG: CoA transferase [Dehalococcoidia bacterium]|jgi:crotonobetainyl-CoA:carnitine CoA-transferase CaiB-like acyl-CoA transferase
MADVTWRNYKEKKHSSPSPLKGIRVLEVCTLLLGPAGPGFLAEMGAEVIKCEIPPMGDTCRDLTPFGYHFREQGVAFAHMNTNKYWMGLDLHLREAQKIFQELAAKADIIENNLRPGVMESWNIGYRQIREINPGIIYLAKNGFGQWGQYAHENRPSNDGASQAFSGYAWLSSFLGQPPLKNRLYICDNYGALMGELAALTALHYREKTGKGQFIELSQTEAIMRAITWVWPYQQLTGKTAMPSGNRDLSICPADTFYCADGSFVAIAAPAPDEFKGLCKAMGRPELADDPRFKEHLARLKDDNATAILKIIADWARTKTTQEIEALAAENGFAASHVYNTKEVVEDRHFRERGFMTEVNDAMLGKYLDHELPVMMSQSPPKVEWGARPVGFDNEYILTEVLGKTEAEIKHLYQCGALGKWADAPTRRPPSDWDGKAGVRTSLDLSQFAAKAPPDKKKKAALEEQAAFLQLIRDRDDPVIAHTKPEALDDITVLDLSYKSYAGCYCSSMLAEFGAKVLRIEPPEGDFIRTCTPYGMLHQGEGLNYLTEGRNKRHITLNLKEAAGREILKKLVAKADVLIETFLPGVMDEWGVGYEELKKLNPKLIFASITGYGQFGPMSRNPMPDYDNIAQARSSVQSATGEVMPEGKSYDDCPWAVPTKAGPWIGWIQPGTFMGVGILAALHWRKTSGRGQALDVATAEAYARFDDYAALWYQETGIICERFGSLDIAGWLYCFAPTKDGAVFLGGLRLEMWQAFADMVGKWDEWGAADWKTLQFFMRKEEQLKWAPLVFAETRKYTNDELVTMSIEYSQKGRLAPITPVVAPVCSPMEPMKDANWLDRGMFTPVKDPVYGEIIVAQAQHKMTKTPIRTKWVCQPVGHENEAVYREYLGFDAARLDELKKTGII